MADTAVEELLPEFDREFLDEKGYYWEVIKEGGELHLIIRGWPIPNHYSPNVADLMIIVPAGYPNSKLDMFWTYPDVKLKNGSWPAQSQHHHAYHGRSWQRWSRHFQQPWRPGIDSIRSYLATVRVELDKGI